MKQINYIPIAGMLSGYDTHETVFVQDPTGQIWESFEGVWTNA
jgi:hypothetical protein